MLVSPDSSSGFFWTPLYLTASCIIKQQIELDQSLRVTVGLVRYAILFVSLSRLWQFILTGNRGKEGEGGKFLFLLRYSSAAFLNVRCFHISFPPDICDSLCTVAHYIYFQNAQQQQSHSQSKGLTSVWGHVPICFNNPDFCLISMAKIDRAHFKQWNIVHLVHARFYELLWWITGLPTVHPELAGYGQHLLIKETA